ncbi:MAG TPA: GTP cyclohydrolase MptA [Methanocella sp.]|nr:GTP cyclohydrolase MptA [Methanocella sp.]
MLPDVQSNIPSVHIGLTRVGVTDVKKMVEVARRNKRPIILIPTFDIFVDLPSNRKGANLSRNLEAIDRTLEDAISRPVYRIEDLCVDVSNRLLDSHEYATNAEVRMQGEYMMKKKSPITGMECQEVYDIYADAIVTRSSTTRKTIGAKVTAMTACPCAQEISRESAFNKLKALGVNDAVIDEFLMDMPMPTHNQRGIGTIMIESDGNVKISIEKIIQVIENSMSSQMYELLKREDEKFVVNTAHKNPKFVEDCVRAMAKNLVMTFPKLPDDAIITIEQVNEESIHRHNAFAERKATFEDLKKEVGVNNVASAGKATAVARGRRAISKS